MGSRVATAALLAAAAIVMLLAPAAHATRTYIDSGAVWVINDDVGQKNDLHMRLAGPGFVVYDRERDVNATSPCYTEQSGAHPWPGICPTNGIVSISVGLGTKDDYVDMDDPVLFNMPNMPGFVQAYGGSGDDRLIGSPDEQALYGDGGNDTIQGMDSRDYLEGGPGKDRLLGGPGEDELNAKDGKRDKRIDCGPGKDQRAKWDRKLDPRPISCPVKRS